jgi:NAD(P)-dependent dehydrogenase (short-subunit alcohol dehydrogenase family)
MQGKICLITGGSAGSGCVTARALARMGARVIIAGRNAQRSRAAAASIEGPSREQPRC